MRLTIAYSKIKKRNLVLIKNATYQRETLTEWPIIRQPLRVSVRKWILNVCTLPFYLVRDVRDSTGFSGGRLTRYFRWCWALLSIAESLKKILMLCVGKTWCDPDPLKTIVRDKNWLSNMSNMTFKFLLVDEFDTYLALYYHQSIYETVKMRLFSDSFWMQHKHDVVHWKLTHQTKINVVTSLQNPCCACLTNSLDI